MRGDASPQWRDFRRLWVADAISQLGTRMTFLAAPLVALYTVQATTFEVALLRTFQSLGALLLGLLVGAWVDRLRCRPVLIASDLGRFVLLVSIPLAALAGVLTLGQLYLVMFGVGVLSIFFDVAHQSYLPRLLPPEALVDANSRLAANVSVAAVAGASSGGYLVQLLTAPVVLAIDGLSFLWSALWIRAVRHREEARPAKPDRHLLKEVGEGLRFVVAHPVLGPLAGYLATSVLCQFTVMAIEVVFLVEVVGLSAGLIGVLGTVGLLGALLSAAIAARIGRALGPARTMVVTACVRGPAGVLLAFTEPGWGLTWYVVSTAVASFCIVLLGVLQMTCQQLVCPPALLGRVNATMEFVVWGVAPLGGLLGGVLAVTVGLRETILYTGIAGVLTALWLLLSPLRRMRDFPVPAESAGADVRQAT